MKGRRIDVGDTVGRFALERVLGRGPMAEVFLAVDPAMGWKVALKVFLLEPGAKPGDEVLWATRMVREATQAAVFRHPNAVVVHEIAEDHGRPFLVRDYIEGKPLSEYVEDRAPETYRWKIFWLLELARVLAAVHAAGLVHRDVKPTNVMVRRDGTLKVLDFGVARRSVDRAAGISVPSSELLVRAPKIRVVGTPAYMAPEQLGHQHVGPPADQFGWGVLAYELLAGVLPWGPEPKPVKMIQAILTHTPDPLHVHEGRVSGALGDLVHRALSKRVEDRYGSMEELVRELESILAYGS